VPDLLPLWELALNSKFFTVPPRPDNQNWLLGQSFSVGDAGECSGWDGPGFGVTVPAGLGYLREELALLGEGGCGRGA